MKIFVTGPQRSGSTFVSHCLAKSFQIPHIDEMEFDVYYVDLFFKIAEQHESWVAQAPALFVDVFKVLDRFPDVTFVVVRRDIEEIIHSQERIDWKDDVERHRIHISSSDQRPIARIKYELWDHWKQYLPSWAEYDYHDFEEHPMWVDEENRKNFTPKQIV